MLPAVRIKKKELLDKDGVSKGEYWETARQMHTTKATMIDLRKERATNQRSSRRSKRSRKKDNIRAKA